VTGILGLRGPRLPVHISKHLQISLIFSGAFLSELAKENAIKISNMKVGGSPLYYLPGQEPLLERFYNYLPSKEKQAFLLLKEKKILQDSKQQPAIRFALRQIKDFAIAFHKDNELFWRFHTFSEQEVKERLKVKKQEVRPIEQTKPEKKQKIEEKPENTQQKVEKKETEKPLIKLKQIKKKKQKEKSWFVLRAEEFLKQENIEILEEISFKKREYVSRVRIDSDLGKIELLCIAKDKKSITERDLSLALNEARERKLLALVVSKADLNKKAEKYMKEWNNLIRFKKIQ